MTRILVADDDPDIARLVALDLEVEGYEIEVVHDGLSALRRAFEWSPDLVVLDVMMPGLDGVEVLRRLRASASTAALPVLLLTAMAESSDKVAGLGAGADDYVVKPFDPAELLARVQTVLRRTAEARAISPLTGLPGNSRIMREIAARETPGTPYAVCHVDLDGFKSYNDAYGFLRGDALLCMLASCLRTAVADAGEPPAFVGHVGGDDFVVVCTPHQVGPITRRVIDCFDGQVGDHYDPDDRSRGYLEVPDRRGALHRHPLVSVSIGVGQQLDGTRDHREVIVAAAEMKSWAKTQPGSLVAVDRRS
jgi:PleD family two-component response regulator